MLAKNTLRKKAQSCTLQLPPLPPPPSQISTHPSFSRLPAVLWPVWEDHQQRLYLYTSWKYPWLLSVVPQFWLHNCCSSLLSQSEFYWQSLSLVWLSWKGLYWQSCQTEWRVPSPQCLGEQRIRYRECKFGNAFQEKKKLSCCYLRALEQFAITW